MSVLQLPSTWWKQTTPSLDATRSLWYLSSFQFIKASLRPLYKACNDYRFSVCACSKPTQLADEKQQWFTSLFVRAKISLHSIYQFCFCILKKKIQGLHSLDLWKFIQRHIPPDRNCVSWNTSEHFPQKGKKLSETSWLQAFEGINNQLWIGGRNKNH